MYFALCSCLKWLGGAVGVYFLCVFNRGLAWDEHVELVSSLALFFYLMYFYYLACLARHSRSMVPFGTFFVSLFFH